MHEVHRPRLIRLNRRATVVAQLHLDAAQGALGAFCAIEAQLPAKPVDGPIVDRAALAPQHQVNALIAIAHPRLGGFLDPLHQSGWQPGLTLVVVGQCLGPQRAATDRDVSDATDLIDQPAPARRPQSFRERTFWRMALSSGRSAISLVSLPFSSSSRRSRFIFKGIWQACFLRRRKTSNRKSPPCGRFPQPAYLPPPASE